MKTATGQTILKIIQDKSLVKPSDIAALTGLSTQAVHWQLRKLLASGQIERRGKPPHTAYAIKEQIAGFPPLPPSAEQTIGQDFSYLDPAGGLALGVEGFKKWIHSKNLRKDFVNLAKAYEKTWHEVYGEDKETPIETIHRLKSILPNLVLKTCAISDFYAIPQFGKTRLGNMVHAAKTSPQPRIIQQIFEAIESEILGIIENHAIDGICFVPHSIPRLKPLLPELAKRLQLNLPEIVCRKVFVDSIPVPQKSLSKLSERIENARRTVFIESSPRHVQRLLIVDDAVGSGATMNELARLFMERGICDEVHGYAVVGSYKGFDVISQV